MNRREYLDSEVRKIVSKKGEKGRGGGLGGRWEGDGREMRGLGWKWEGWEGHGR